MAKLGELKKVDLRTQWPNEAADLTPWLAKEDSIAKLAAALGLELEVEGVEVAVGPYSADIVARDAGSGDPVVIENQLGKTNHDHLGKCITYASVLGASAVVWLAASFSDEHRKALEWLNENSTGDVGFYGVRLELWQIDESLPAVRFNVVSYPADIMRPGPTPAPLGELSENRKLQLEWWTTVRDELLRQKVVPSVQSPRPQHWYNVALGRSGFHLSCTANTWDKVIGVRVYMRNKYGADEALKQLLESRDKIEEEIGQKLQWNPNPEAMDKTIVAHLDADLARKDQWPDYVKWMVDMVARFRKAFGPRVKDLDLGGHGDSDDTPDE